MQVQHWRELATLKEASVSGGASPTVDGALAQERERAASLERYRLSYATLT